MKKKEKEKGGKGRERREEESRGVGGEDKGAPSSGVKDPRVTALPASRSRVMALPPTLCVLTEIPQVSSPLGKIKGN